MYFSVDNIDTVDRSIDRYTISCKLCSYVHISYIFFVKTLILLILFHIIFQKFLIRNLCSRNIYFNHQLSMMKINVLNNILAENVRIFQ